MTTANTAFDYGPARDALYRDSDNLARWCGTCSSESCDDCIAIRDDAARAVIASMLPQIREALTRELRGDPQPTRGWRVVGPDD